MTRSFGRVAFLTHCTVRDASYMTGMLSLPGRVADLYFRSPWMIEESAVSVQTILNIQKARDSFVLEKVGLGIFGYMTSVFCRHLGIDYSSRFSYFVFYHFGY